jgi:hypothetical protein
VNSLRTGIPRQVILASILAGGARLRVRFADRSGAALDYIVDVFDRDGGSSGARALLTRHWVVRDVYPADQQPLYWTWSDG